MQIGAATRMHVQIERAQRLVAQTVWIEGWIDLTDCASRRVQHDIAVDRFDLVVHRDAVIGIQIDAAINLENIRRIGEVFDRDGAAVDFQVFVEGRRLRGLDCSQTHLPTGRIRMRASDVVIGHAGLTADDDFAEVGT